MKLSEKHEKAADLAGRLSNSLDLQDIFPNIFDLGGARACVYSTGQRGRPMFRLTRGDGTKEEMPLVNAPTVLIRHYSCLIRLKAKEFPVVHRDWKICEKVLYTPGEALPPCYTCPHNKTDAWGADSCVKNIIPHVGGGGINEAKMRIHMVTCDRETRATVDGYGEIYKK